MSAGPMTHWLDTPGLFSETTYPIATTDPLDSSFEATLDQQLLRDIEPYYGELERGFAATHVPQVGTTLASVGFSTVAKLAYGITKGTVVIGKVVVTLKRGSALKIGPIVILPEHRDRGCATSFLQWLVPRAHARGVPCVLATVPEGNRAAQSVFARAGFRKVGTLIDHYREGSSEDVFTHECPAAQRNIEQCLAGSSMESESLLERLRQYVIEQFFPVDPAWERWLGRATGPSLGNFDRKPHDIVHDDRGGMALVIYKRGGTAKVVPVVSGQPPSMALLRACEQAASHRGRRKISVFLPANVRGPTGYCCEIVAIECSFRRPIAVWSRHL